VLLDRAIAFFVQAQLRDQLPDAYLRRARASRSTGNDTAALSDYDNALREVNAQRNMIGSDLQLRFLDTAAQVIDESIDFHLARGSIREALAIADRTRELREMPPISAPPSRERQVLPATAVIEYVVLPHSIAIFCVTEGQISVQKVPMEREDLAQRIASFEESIRRRVPLDQITPEATALFTLLIAPVQSRLSRIDQIVIVPDRQLFSVPFAALYDAASARYLAEEFTIRFAPASSAVDQATANGALQPALVVADPTTPNLPRLPASMREGERIAASYGAITLSGDTATRKRFLGAATDSALIHYAGHADSDAGDSYGALLLAGANGDSGVLASSDIAALRLSKHPLVVLAACGSFRGGSTHVGGMSSLARAFLLAGARAVAGSLWEIDDDVAAALFLRFHEHLQAGESPACAVRNAQIEMIHASDPRLRHPATWAPVELLSSF